MKNPLWSAIYDLFQDIDNLLTHGELSGSAPAAVAAGKRKPAGNVKRTQQIATVEGLRAAFDESEDMMNARSVIRSRLDVLKASLASTLTERETYLVLFPAVVFADEMVRNKFPEQASTWPPLQKELFRIDNGGEMFYETLDDLLRKPETHPFVYEVYYLCLSYGFRGRHADNLAKINEYKSKVEAKIPLPVVERTEAKAGPEVIEAGRMPAWYYAAAALFVVGSYVGLYAIARF